jgi:hypothetical protein
LNEQERDEEGRHSYGGASEAGESYAHAGLHTPGQTNGRDLLPKIQHFGFGMKHLIGVKTSPNAVLRYPTFYSKNPSVQQGHAHEFFSPTPFQLHRALFAQSL